MTDDQHPLVGRTITGFRTLGPGDGLGRYFNDYALVCVLELDDGTMLGSAIEEENGGPLVGWFYRVDPERLRWSMVQSEEAA
jgi:hypothetical protein